jgi:hypothetical protein
MRLDLSKNNPVEMVGDGKVPNRFWVTAQTDFAFIHIDAAGICYQDWAEELMKEHGIKSEPLSKHNAVFDDVNEAVEYAKELCSDMYSNQEPKPNIINDVMIEDRLCGIIWECQLVAHSRKWGGWAFQVEEQDDRKMLEKLSVSLGIGEKS